MAEVKNDKGMDIDTNLYSRQIGTFGMETMGKLIKMRVLISGLRGCGVETAKNLILAGPKKVVLHDDGLVTQGDLGSNFYCSPSHVGTTPRSEASIASLKELNPYVDVSIKSGEIDNAFLANFDVVVFTEGSLSKMLEFNEFCRAQTPAIGFIMSRNFGVSGNVFVDFGEKFRCFDPNGEECKSAIISGITNEETGIVTVHEDKRHGFSDDDHVVFREIEGTTELNGSEPLPIKVLSGFTFSIGDTSKMGQYVRGGIVEQIKVPQYLKFHSLRESLDNPIPEGKDMLDVPDLAKFGRSEQLHLAQYAVMEYQARHGSLPVANNKEHAAECVAIAKEKKETTKLMLEELEEDVINNVALYAECQINPMSAFLGGIVAQEIVKFTGKYSPLRQWIHFDAFETLPQGEVDRTPKGDRYDDQVKIFGCELQKKLGDLKYFLVGAGALGCEFLKNFALMGLACGEGKVVCTDNDNIEISNLNRQFLFRKENVGASKSVTACASARRMNSTFNVEASETRVGPENEHIWNDEFWNGLDGVTNAVDNINARMYVDSRCVWYGKSLLESGTLGTKANVQVVIPHKTQSYGDSQDPPEESIPMCTLHNFPNNIDHTIQWARDVFEGLFTDGPQEVQSYLKSPQEYLQGLKKEGNSNTQRAKLEQIKTLLGNSKVASFEKCVELARFKFGEFFHDKVAQLLYTFPPDAKNRDGSLFWSGPKRVPTPVVFDKNDETHINFVVSAANLFAYNLGIPENRDVAFVAECASQVKVPTFVPKKMSIKVDEKDTTETKAEDDDEVLDRLMQELSVCDYTATFHPADFEKDDDENFHIAFIAAGANLRARNYSIQEVDRQKVKMIAGKIIPAIATTTAMVTGAVCLEIYKLLQTDDVEKFKNGFINLALPLWVFSEPLPPVQKKSVEYDPICAGPVRAKPEGFTSWDKVEIKGPCTLQELFDQIGEQYNVNTSMLSAGKCILYNQYHPGGKHKERLGKSVHEIYASISKEPIPEGRRYLAVEVSCEDKDDMVDVMIPAVKYTW